MAKNMDYMGIQGHLATITSDEENWWIVENLGGALTLDHWLGGIKNNDDWQWITGEVWDYTNWWNTNGWLEPSGEHNAALQFDDMEKEPPVPGYWNDLDRHYAEIRKSPFTNK